MKWYRCGSWGDDIREVEVVRETEKCLFYMVNGKERRINKSGYYETYFKTREEAVNSVRSRLGVTVLNAKNRLKSAEEELEKFNSKEAT